MKADESKGKKYLANNAGKYLALYFASKGYYSETKIEKIKRYIKAHLFFSTR